MESAALWAAPGGKGIVTTGQELNVHMYRRSCEDGLLLFKRIIEGQGCDLVKELIVSFAPPNAKSSLSTNFRFSTLMALLGATHP